MTLYLALSGGRRQILDLAFLLLARVAGAATFIHHHSFAYINKTSWLTRAVVRVNPAATHIVLGPKMGQGLEAVYGPMRTHIVSNAIFAGVKPASQREAHEGITLGFMSNITAEKGVFEFLDVCREATARGLPIRGVLAGPLVGEIAAEFNAAIVDLPNVEYIGPVYGEQKAAFFHRVDYFLFPTKYRNEAEPVVLLEALSNGIPVISRDRGCIADMLTGAGSLVVGRSEPFCEKALNFVLSGCGTYGQRSELATRRFNALRADSEAALDVLASSFARAARRQSVGDAEPRPASSPAHPID